MDMTSSGQVLFLFTPAAALLVHAEGNIAKGRAVLRRKKLDVEVLEQSNNRSLHFAGNHCVLQESVEQLALSR